jgi:hypothetical protein
VTALDARVSEVSRRLRSRADGILAAVWYMPEASTGYAGIPLASATASLASRAACLGAVRGEVAGALLAPINPAGVARAIDEAWTVTTPEALLVARLECSVAHLERVLGPAPDGLERANELLLPAATAGTTEGHPVYAGLREIGLPGTPMGDLWRACDLVRERRGDSHRNTWVAAGFDPVEINVLTELWRDVPIGSVATNQMGWSQRACDNAVIRLEAAGLVRDGSLTDSGRAVRDDIEVATDRQERTMVDTLGDDADELLEILAPWARVVITSGPRPWENP